ncbi:MAG: divalent metal cation transporter [Bacteroidota bacterium]
MFTIKNRISSVLIWSVISAAFIGPGTLAAASSAGALFKYNLIWALLFATFACIILQEMSARVSIVTGYGLSSVLKRNLKGSVAVFMGSAVVLGCAAYEAGNILGALEGISVLVDVNRYLLLLLIGSVLFLLLVYGNRRSLSKMFGVLVFLMGAVFIFVAFNGDHRVGELIQGAVPNLPNGAQWVTLALIGTTIVPYNVYLGSGLSQGQSISEMRFGLIISVSIGGIISMAILVVATQMVSLDSFLDMAQLLGDRLGPWAYLLLGLGLFAAGFTSSLTAPMAAGMITAGLLDNDTSSVRKSYRAGGFIVLAAGLLFGMLNVKPIPVIVTAQALNGLILPLLGIFLLVTTNDRALMKEKVNSGYMNLASFIVLQMLLWLGLNGLWNAVSTVVSLKFADNLVKFIVIQTVSLILLSYTGYLVYQKRTA